MKRRTSEPWTPADASGRPLRWPTIKLLNPNRPLKISDRAPAGWWR